LNLLDSLVYLKLWGFASLNSDGVHQVPPQPLQEDWDWLHHPLAQLPPQLLDHLQQAGEGAGVGVGGAVVGSGDGGVGGVGGVGVGGVGGAVPLTTKSMQARNVSGNPPPPVHAEA